jgi:hypothetical protein
MFCGRCCVTEPRLRAALRLDIFIEILLGTRAKLFRRCRTRRNSGTSVRHSTLEDSPTPPGAVPCNHVRRRKGRAFELATAALLLPSPRISCRGLFSFYEFCR